MANIKYPSNPFDIVPFWTPPLSADDRWDMETIISRIESQDKLPEVVSLLNMCNSTRMHFISRFLIHDTPRDWSLYYRTTSVDDMCEVSCLYQSVNSTIVVAVLLATTHQTTKRYFVESVLYRISETITRSTNSSIQRMVLANGW